MIRPLKLRACDGEDLQVLSGYLQDAIVPIGEMCFVPADRRFAMVVSRFRWETCSGDAAAAPPRTEGDAGLEDAESPACYERVHCGICFDGIEAARTRGVDLRDRGVILNLLTIGEEEGAVVMHFSGGACIRLDGRDWTCRIEDLGEPWPTSRRPCHLFEEPEAGAA